MLITYFRSSSFNTVDFCEHQYFLRYVLGIEDASNKKADMGNIVHKALELLGLRKLAQQNGELMVSDEAFGGKPVSRASIDPQMAYETAWRFCTSQFTNHKWDEKDKKACQKMMYAALEYGEGMFNPLNLNLVGVERKFDMEIIKPWSKYSFKGPDGKLFEGYLGLKGTVDLIANPTPGVIELIDWKTGRRMCWNTGQEKTIDKLRSDPQLRLYHYAAHHAFPEAEAIFVTIFFITDGGPYSIYFDKNDLPQTEEMIREQYIRVRDTMRPKRIYPDWKCSKLCHFGKNNQPGTNKSICQHYKEEIVRLGIDKVTNKYADFDALTRYGAGGGKYAAGTN